MVRLLLGDITQEKVDAIVNAANPVMLGGGGVDGAIHRAAGPALLAACQAVPVVHGQRCPTGEARITVAGNLPSRYVIHTVGPRYGVDSHPELLLAAAYRNSLQLALKQGCCSVSFPAISCGVFGYPEAEAAKVALTVCQQEEYDALEIRFCLFSQASLAIWERVYNDSGTLLA